LCIEKPSLKQIQERNIEICSLYEIDGLSQAGIAKRYNISRERVRQILNASRINIKTPIIEKVKPQLNDIEKMLNDGLPIRIISDLLNVNYDYLRRIINSKGIDIAEIRRKLKEEKKCPCGEKVYRIGMCSKCYHKYLYYKHNEKIKTYSRKYYKEYRRKNLEKIREYYRKYDKEYYQKNKEKFQEKRKRYYEADKEKNNLDRKEYFRKYNATKADNFEIEEKELNDTITNNINKLIKLHQTHIRELAVVTGINLAVFKHRLTNRRLWKISDIIKVANFYNVSVDILCKKEN
jgi:hypothetical protein